MFIQFNLTKHGFVEQFKKYITIVDYNADTIKRKQTIPNSQIQKYKCKILLEPSFATTLGI